MNPSSDIETIKTELILADMETVEKAIPRLEKEDADAEGSRSHPRSDEGGQGSARRGHA